jgi:hypothetical protein
MFNSFRKSSGKTIVQVDARELTNWVRGTNTRQARIIEEFDKLANKGYNDLGELIVPISKTSKLYNSRNYDVSVGIRLDTFTLEIGLRAPYAKQAMDDGTPPGSFEGKDDYQHLKRWVGLTFGITGKERDRVAFLVARKINQVGSRKYREKQPKLWENFINDFTGDLERSLDKIGEIYIK